MRHALLRLAVLLPLAAAAAAPAAADEAAHMAQDQALAENLAAMLRAGRTVISSNQPKINDPALGDKGLTGAAVLADTVAIFTKSTGIDPATIDPASRQGRLLRAQMASIVEVMDANQATLNAKGTGFKGFIPAVFARLVNEAFARRAGGEAVMKVTAPPPLVRNRKSRPDAWELNVIDTKFDAPGWPHGAPYAAMMDTAGHETFRMMVPEYYTPSCLTCHGAPKGSMDITGYPREGAADGDLGSAISITLNH